MHSRILQAQDKQRDLNLDAGFGCRSAQFGTHRGLDQGQPFVAMTPHPPEILHIRNFPCSAYLSARWRGRCDNAESRERFGPIKLAKMAKHLPQTQSAAMLDVLATVMGAPVLEEVVALIPKVSVRLVETLIVFTPHEDRDSVYKKAAESGVQEEEKQGRIVGLSRITMKKKNNFVVLN